MASITKKIKKGRPYYYAVESKCINGTPRIVWQKYLGTLEGIVNHVKDAKPLKPKHTFIENDYWRSAGNLCAFTIEASRRGKIDYKIDYGDVDAIAELLKKIANPPNPPLPKGGGIFSFRKGRQGGF